MPYLIINASTFDGSTPAPSTATLRQISDGVWTYTDAGSPFAALGVVNVDALFTLLLSATGMAFVTTFRHLGGNAVTEMIAQLQIAGTSAILADRRYDPSVSSIGVSGFAVLGEGNELVLTTNDGGNQSIAMQVIALNSVADILSANAANDMYGAVEPAGPVLVGPLTTATEIDESKSQAVLYDTSGGAFTITLPRDPVAGDVVTLLEDANSAVNALTIDGNGNQVQAAAGTYGASTTYQIASGWIQFLFDGTQWHLTNIRT